MRPGGSHPARRERRRSPRAAPRGREARRSTAGSAPGRRRPTPRREDVARRSDADRARHGARAEVDVSARARSRKHVRRRRRTKFDPTDELESAARRSLQVSSSRARAAGRCLGAFVARRQTPPAPRACSSPGRGRRARACIPRARPRVASLARPRLAPPPPPARAMRGSSAPAPLLLLPSGATTRRRCGDRPSGGSYDEQLAVVRALADAGASPRPSTRPRNSPRPRAGATSRAAPSRKAARCEKRRREELAADGEDAAARFASRDDRRPAPPRGPVVTCPACEQPIKAAHPDQFRQHASRCFPDALAAVPNALWSDPRAAADALAAREADLEIQCKARKYRGSPPGTSGGGDDERSSFRSSGVASSSDASVADVRRPSDAEVGDALGLSASRVRSILRRASRAVPLVADAEPLEVLHEDDEILVVDKPPGLRFHPVHRFQGGSLLNRAIGHAARRASAEGNKKESGAAPPAAPRVVHRLDMDTSGVCLLVKDPSLADGFARQFRGEGPGAKLARKTYVALAVGRLPPLEDFEVDAPVGPHPTIPEARSVVQTRTGRRGEDDDGESLDDDGESLERRRASSDPPESPPKPARTACAILASAPFEARAGDVSGDRDFGEGTEEGGSDGKKTLPGRPPPVPVPLHAALVLARPLTGRTHQIRVHLAHRSLPIRTSHGRTWWGGAPTKAAGTGTAAAAGRGGGAGAGRAGWGGRRARGAAGGDAPADGGASAILRADAAGHARGVRERRDRPGRGGREGDGGGGRMRRMRRMRGEEARAGERRGGERARREEGRDDSASSAHHSERR